MLLLLVLGSFHLPLTSVRAHGVRLVGTVLCFKESAAETDGWHVSSTATKGRGWVQPSNLSSCTASCGEGSTAAGGQRKPELCRDRTCW